MLGRRPAVLALCVFGVGFAIIWAGFSPLSQEPFQFCPGAPQTEGSSVRTEPSLWPPGTTRCEYGTPAGSSSRAYVPWGEWLALALLAAAVGVAARRPLRLGVAIGLALAALFVVFGV